MKMSALRHGLIAAAALLPGMISTTCLAAPTVHPSRVIAGSSNPTTLGPTSGIAHEVGHISRGHTSDRSGPGVQARMRSRANSRGPAGGGPSGELRGNCPTVAVAGGIIFWAVTHDNDVNDVGPDAKCNR